MGACPAFAGEPHSTWAPLADAEWCIGQTVMHLHSAGSHTIPRTSSASGAQNMATITAIAGILSIRQMLPQRRKASTFYFRASYFRAV